MNALTMVRAQAKDGGLWFDATLAPEAYLQTALRRLHAAVEKDAEVHSQCHSVPEGWKLVPTKLTKEMQAAGYWSRDGSNQTLWDQILAAAPECHAKGAEEKR